MHAACRSRRSSLVSSVSPVEIDHGLHYHSTTLSGGGGGKGKGSKDKVKQGKDRGEAAKATELKDWKMWKHPCKTFDSSGRRCCDNQGCDNVLTQELYKSAYRRQKLKDERSASSGYGRLPVWHQCGECHATSDEDGKIIMPDGYKPKSNTTDSSKAMRMDAEDVEER